MKAIIYAGIGLFSAATVYGLADYYSTQKKGTLDQLYKEQEEVVVIPEKKEVAKNDVTTVIDNNKKTNETISSVAVATKKIKKPKRTISFDDFSRGRIPEPVNITIPEKEEPVKNVVTPVQEVKIQPVVEPAPVEKVEKRRFSLDEFSRAPLRVKKYVVKKS